MTPQENILYGIHPILEMLRAQKPMTCLYMAMHQNKQEAEKICALARSQQIPIFKVDPDRLRKMAGTTKHQGVLAMVARRLEGDLETLLAIPAERKEPPFFLLIDSVEDPHNLGALLRTAEAAGVHGVIIPKRRAAGPSPVVAKASAGAMAHIPMAQVNNLAQTIDRFQKEGIPIIGLDAHSPRSFWEYDFRDAIALVVGGEGRGLHAKIHERCDAIISLPMRGIIESLNVSVATGIVLYEALRQRKEKP